MDRGIFIMARLVGKFLNYILNLGFLRPCALYTFRSGIHNSFPLYLNQVRYSLRRKAPRCDVGMVRAGVVVRTVLVYVRGVAGAKSREDTRTPSLSGGDLQCR